jgi:hypothetical protein
MVHTDVGLREVVGVHIIDEQIHLELDYEWQEHKETS